MPIDTAPGTLSGHAASIYKSAFNAAYSGSCADSGDRRDECASRIAWSAVKKSYRKEGDSWVKVADESMKSKEILTAVEATDFDDELQEAWVTIVQPGVSANRRNHKAPAIRRAVENGIWNNSPMFVDHAEDRKMPLKRKLLDLVSVIKRTEVGDDGRARGRVKFFNKDFYEFAKEAKDHIGISMTTLFKGKQWKEHGLVYEEVDDYVRNISVDWVAFPAAGGAIEKFLPAFESEDDVDWSEVTLEDLKQHAPSLVSQIEQSAVEAAGSSSGDSPPSGGDGDTISKADVQQMIDVALEDAQIKWDEIREKERQTRVQVTDFVNKAGLPPKMRGQVIDDLVEKGSFEEKVAQEAVDSAWEVLKDAGLPGPKITGAGNSGTPDSKDGNRDSDSLEKAAPAMLAFESAMGYKPKQEGAN